MRPNRQALHERELQPIHGAFGFDKALQVGEFMRRADKDFLDGTGRYKGLLRIHIEEEYGFRDWLWTYPGTIKQLADDWKEGRRPVSPSCRVARGVHAYTGRNYFDGELDEIFWDRDYYLSDDGEEHVHRWPVLVTNQEQLRFVQRKTKYNGFDGYAHIHEQDDSYLHVGYYKLTGLDDVGETIDVLDALADIV